MCTNSDCCFIILTCNSAIASTLNVSFLVRWFASTTTLPIALSKLIPGLKGGHVPLFHLHTLLLGARASSLPIKIDTVCSTTRFSLLNAINITHERIVRQKPFSIVNSCKILVWLIYANLTNYPLTTDTDLIPLIRASIFFFFRGE
jgi:hypothetical protein